MSSSYSAWSSSAARQAMQVGNRVGDILGSLRQGPGRGFPAVPHRKVRPEPDARGARRPNRRGAGNSRVVNRPGGAVSVGDVQELHRGVSIVTPSCANAARCAVTTSSDVTTPAGSRFVASLNVLLPKCTMGRNLATPYRACSPHPIRQATAAATAIRFHPSARLENPHARVPLLPVASRQRRDRCH